MIKWPCYVSLFIDSEIAKLHVCTSIRSPTGKVFSDEDLEFIARLCVKYNTYAVCDEARGSIPNERMLLSRM